MRPSGGTRYGSYGTGGGRYATGSGMHMHSPTRSAGGYSSPSARHTYNASHGYDRTYPPHRGGRSSTARPGNAATTGFVHAHSRRQSTEPSYSMPATRHGGGSYSTAGAHRAALDLWASNFVRGLASEREKTAVLDALLVDRATTHGALEGACCMCELDGCRCPTWLGVCAHPGMRAQFASTVPSPWVWSRPPLLG